MDDKLTGNWSDREILNHEEDRFGSQDYADVLKNRAVTADTPLTIGVFGRWGSGKTSLMRLVQEELSRVKSIWINVWQLSNREELWNAFLQGLFTQVYKKLTPFQKLSFNWGLFWRRVRPGELVRQLLVNSYRIVIAATPLLLAVLWPDDTVQNSSELLAFALDPITGGTASLVLGLWLLVSPAVGAAKEKVSLDLDVVLKKNPFEVQVTELQTLQKNFEKLVEKLVGKDGRLIVFIDDLDRCTPDKIPDVLEAIKLFTNTKRCVYILGLDHEIVTQGVGTRYKIKDFEADEYLEKIIQIPFHLPPLDEDRIVRFVVDDYADVHAISETAPEVFSNGLEPNPRKIKRALNIYRTLWELAQKRVDEWEMDPVEPELLAKMVVLQSRFSDLNKYFQRQPEFMVKVEARAKSDDSDENQETQKLLQDLVPEDAQTALFNMLNCGKKRFGELPNGGLTNYIYLTGTAEGISALMRPSRKEREALLSNNPEQIQEQVALILARGSDEAEKEKLAHSYMGRLASVVDRIGDQPDPNTLNSAGYATLWFEIMGLRPEQRYRLSSGDNLVNTIRNDHRKFDESDPLWMTGYLKALWEALARNDLPGETAEQIQHCLRDAGIPQMILIPSGEFQMGEGREIHRLDLVEYAIGKYPVTNKEYLAFVEAKKYKLPDHWVDGHLPEGKSDHPVVNVTWHDAIAYCRWLADRTGLSFMLPSEAEWEKAARGEKDNRSYPWGPEFDASKCNTSEAEIADTTPVGRFSPLGDSPFGCVDMSGNVWEWTRSNYKNYPYNSGDGREDLEAGDDVARVLRGGSFYHYRSYARVSFRYDFDPDGRRYDFGFRVALPARPKAA